MTNLIKPLFLGMFKNRIIGVRVMFKMTLITNVGRKFPFDNHWKMASYVSKLRQHKQKSFKKDVMPSKRPQNGSKSKILKKEIPKRFYRFSFDYDLDWNVGWLRLHTMS